MNLGELKKILEGVKTTNVRFGGFCDDYNLLPTQYQIGFDDTRKRVWIYNDIVYDKIEGLKVFDQTTMRYEFMSLPEKYDDYDLFLRGRENTEETTILVKEIKCADIIQVPGDDSKTGVCLLGPTPVLSTPYYTIVVIEDEKADELFRPWGFGYFLEAYLPEVRGFGEDELVYLDHHQNGTVIIDFYSDAAHSSMLLAMLDGRYKGVYFSRVCIDVNESTLLTNDVKGKYFRPYSLRITFADTRDTIISADTGETRDKLDFLSLTNLHEYYLEYDFDTAEKREECLTGLKEHVLDERVGDRVYKWDIKSVTDIMELVLDPDGLGEKQFEI